MTPIYALMFEKHVQMCVYIRHIKKPVYIHYTYVKQKKVGWEVNFSEHGLAGSRARKPRQELESSALDFISTVFEAQWGLNCVYNY